jgi:hypothetical protein
LYSKFAQAIAASFPAYAICMKPPQASKKKQPGSQDPGCFTCGLNHRCYLSTTSVVLLTEVELPLMAFTCTT